MKLLPTLFSDSFIIEPQVFGDERGFFMETYQANWFLERGISANFVQDNHSGSHQGTLRGLHYQIRQAQGKLVRVVAGEIFDVIVDLRRFSPTFGKWEGKCLSTTNKHQLWIPPGFAHGFYVISEWAEITYKATNFYAPQWERTLLWNDPQIGIQWPVIADKPILVSPKDAKGIPLEQAECYEES